MFFINAFQEGTNQWWKYLLTFIMVLLGMMLGSLPYFVAIYVGIGNKNPTFSSDQIVAGIFSMDTALHDLDPNMILVLMLLQFILGFAFLYIFVRSLHLKQFASLVSARNNVNWLKMLKAFGVWFLLLGLMEGVGYWQHPENYQWNFQPSAFLVLVLIALILLPIQTSLEELLIRGYLMQGVGLLVKNRWLPIIITALVFAAMHGANPEVAAYGASKMMLYYFVVGLFFAVVTVMDDGLEIALGFHAANNIFVATMVNSPDAALATPALFINASTDTDGMILFTVVLFVLVLLIAKRVLKWGSWRKLIAPIKY